MSQYFPSLIPYRKGSLWGYTDSNKNTLIPMEYDQTFPFIGNIAKVMKDGKFGVINREGVEVLPIQYEEIGSIVHDAFTNEDNSVTFSLKQKFGLLSTSGQVLANAQFNSPEEAIHHAKGNGWKGAIINEDFPFLNEEALSKIEMVKHRQNGMFAYRENGKWGLMDENSQVICRPIYDSIESSEHSYWPITKNRLWGLLDSNGEEVLPTIYEETRGFYNGLASCKQQGKWGAVDISGKWVIDPQFTEIGDFKEGLIAAQKVDLFGFIDQKGVCKIDFQFQDVMDFEKGMCAIFEGNDIYFIDLDGHQIGERYTRIFGPSAEGFIHVMSGDQWGLVKTDGEWLLPIKYDLPKAMGQVIQVISEGMIPIKTGAYLGFVDLEGKEVIAAKYATIDPFKEGLSLVSVLDERLSFGQTLEMIEASGSLSGNFKFGFIDKKGDEIVPPKYTLANRFERGLAFVQNIDGLGGYITYDGTEYFEDI